MACIIYSELRKFLECATVPSVDDRGVHPGRVNPILNTGGSIARPFSAPWLAALWGVLTITGGQLDAYTCGEPLKSFQYRHLLSPPAGRTFLLFFVLTARSLAMFRLSQSIALSVISKLILLPRRSTGLAVLVYNLFSIISLL